MTDYRFCCYCRNRRHLPFDLPCVCCDDSNMFEPEIPNTNSKIVTAYLVTLAVTLVMIFLSLVCLSPGTW